MLGSASPIFPISSAYKRMCLSMSPLCLSRCSCVRAGGTRVNRLMAEAYISACLAESKDIPFKTPLTAGFAISTKELLNESTILFSILIWSLRKFINSSFELKHLPPFSGTCQVGRISLSPISFRIAHISEDQLDSVHT